MGHRACMAYPHGPMTRAPARPDADLTPVTAAAEPTAPASLAMLSHAVEEVARLLDADGAMVYLVDDGLMRFAVDAGIRNPGGAAADSGPDAPDRRRDLRLRRGDRRARRHDRLSAGQALRALRGRGPHRARREHAIDGRGSPHCRRRGARGPRRVLEPHRRLRRVGARAAPRPGRSRCRGRLQSAADRAARGRQGRAGSPGRRAAHARRDRGTHRGDPGACRGPPIGRRSRQAADRLGRRAPDADGARRTIPAPDRRHRRQSGLDRGVVHRARVPDRRRDQRPRRRAGPGDRHRGLPRRSTHPARAGRSPDRRAPRAAGDGGRTAPRSRRRGDGHAGGLVRATASVRR